MARLVDFSSYYKEDDNGIVQALRRQVDNTLTQLNQMDTNGSQFFITQAHYSDYNAVRIKASKQFPLSIVDQYKLYGGDLLNLYKKYTVFGQVFEGMDIVDRIAAVETDAYDKPTTDVVIESIEVTTYSK